MKLFSVGTEMNKAKVKMNKSEYLGLSILDISKTVMNEFWNDCIKPKYQGDAMLWKMNTDNFIIYTKTENIYIHIAINARKKICHIKLWNWKTVTSR